MFSPREAEMGAGEGCRLCLGCGCADRRGFCLIWAFTQMPLKALNMTSVRHLVGLTIHKGCTLCYN